MASIKPVITNKMPRNYELRKAVQANPIYKNNTRRRDASTRKFFEDQQYAPRANQSKLKLGSMYLMEYFEPKTEEELEYYDAMPCTIMFGRMKTKKGEPRIIGFNLHYYPPRMRYLVLDRVLKIFEPLYQKIWAKKDPDDINHIDYKMLIDQLEKAKLAFGIRMYIPDLIGKCVLVEPRFWDRAVFTEGRFKKRTREAILNYWKQYKPK